MGWAAVPADRIVAGIRRTRWSKDNPCPEELIFTTVACLQETGELEFWSLSKLAETFGCSRKRVTRLVLEWAHWMAEAGPQMQRALPLWLSDLLEARHRKGTGREPTLGRPGATNRQPLRALTTSPEKRRPRSGTGRAPRARSSRLDFSHRAALKKAGMRWSGDTPGSG